MVDFEAATDRVIGGLEKRNKVLHLLLVFSSSAMCCAPWAALPAC